MKAIILSSAFVLISMISHAQIHAASLLGSHAGSLNWERTPGTIEFMENYVYVMRSYNFENQVESEVKGRWRVEGDRVILTDLVGLETVLYKNKDEFYITGSSGYSCVARFYLNMDLDKFLAERRKAGC